MDQVTDLGLAGFAFLGWLIGLFVLKYIILIQLRRLAKKTKTAHDDVVIDILRKIRIPFYLLTAGFAAIHYIDLAAWIETSVRIAFIVALVYEVVRAVDRLIEHLFLTYAIKEGDDEASEKTALAGIRLAVRILLWAFGVILLLSNLGVNVTSLIAGLGIGGIAIALAIQNVLGDIFSAFTIYIDKPFRVGDFIVIGNSEGTVEKIGLKNTRLRTLQGEQLVISNAELTSARVQNFKRMERRRMRFTLGIVYETSEEKLRRIPNIIKEIASAIDKADFGRCHFENFGDSALNFEIVIYVNSADYNTFIDIKQRINLEIFKRFANEGIEFAYPTQTIHLDK